MLRIGHFASENQGFHTIHLIPASCKRVSLGSMTPQSTLTDTGASQDKYVPGRSDKVDGVLNSTVLRQSLSQLQSDLRRQNP